MRLAVLKIADLLYLATLKNEPSKAIGLSIYDLAFEEAEERIGLIEEALVDASKACQFMLLY